MRALSRTLLKYGWALRDLSDTSPGPKRDWPPGVAAISAVQAYERRKNYDMSKIVDMMGWPSPEETRCMQPVVDGIKEFNEKYQQ